MVGLIRAPMSHPGQGRSINEAKTDSRIADGSIRAALAVGVGTAALLAIAATAVPGHAASRVTSPSVPAGTMVVQGSVAGASGHAAAGARVVLYAWPNSSVLKGMRVGQRVPVVTVGSAVTNASGHYSITYSSLAALKSLESSTGVVNFQAVSSGSSGVGSFSFSRQLTGEAHGALTASSVPGATPASQPVNMRLAGTKGTVTPQEECGWFESVNYGPEWTVVGTTYVTATSGVAQGFDYGNGQNSTLGVGFSAGGSAGTFSADGTITISNTSSTSFPSYGSGTSWRYESRFTYGLFANPCIGDEVEATGFAGGATTSRMTAAPAAPYCSSYIAGTTFTQYTSTSETLTTAYAVSQVGFDGSGQTGYSHTAQDSFSFTATRYLCGVKGYPGGSPGPGQLVGES